MDVVDRLDGDVHELWVYGANCYIDKALSELPEYRRATVLASR